MARTDSTGSTWRYRWARQQNERRLRAYHGADGAWRRRDEDLRRLRALAEGCHGTAEAGNGLPLELAADEVVFRVLPAVHLVEVRHTAVLPAPDLTVTPQSGPLRARRPDGVRIADTGIAVITSRRLVLLGGRGRRDWAYGRMTGLAHDPHAPVTLIQVLDRRRASGLMLPVDTAADFRFVLTLAFADAIEQRHAVVAQLDELIAEHAQLKPFRPGIATPAQARLSSLVPGGRRTVAVAAGLVLMVPVALAKSDPSDPTGSEVAVAATPAPHGSPAAAATTTPKPRAATGSAGPRRGGTSPSPAGDQLCGAPANPLGYDFCGGSRIRRPAAEVCDWFDCVPQFWAGRGYLVQCRDGAVSLAGGSPRACAAHEGVRRTVWN